MTTGRVEELLGAVGMDSRARDPVRELSRGMVQRVAAARAVLHDPPLLLLDEPRAGLDPAAAEQLEPLIGRASGRTRVVVTHDVNRGLAEADAVLGLRAGRSAVARPAATAEAKDKFRAAFAALPQREREIAVMLYVKNLTLAEIGDVLGVSESRVCQIHGEMKKKLRKALEDDAEILRLVA